MSIELGSEFALDPRAARAADAVRDVPEEPCPYRTAFQRDRDRILHTKAFRRLKHKTQVFVTPEGDHYRTRLDAHLGGLGARAHGRPGAAPQRGSGRGHRDGP